MRNFDLTPLMRSSVGFDRLNELFQSSLKDENSLGFPPYNIAKHDEDHYHITMALAGFKQQDINIILQKNLLSVTGKVAESVPEQQVTYLYKGIANRAFERKFNLADYMKVVSAKLNDGILTIELMREIPDEVKPKQIVIQS